MISSGDSSQVKLVKGAAIIMAGLVFARLINYLYQIFLARAGGAGEFGLFFLGVSVIAFTGGLAGLGLGSGVARFAPLYRGREDDSRLRGMLRAAIVCSLASGILAGLVLSLADNAIALLVFDNPRLVGILHICSVCLPFYVGNRVLAKAVTAFQKVGYRVAAHQFLGPVVRLALTAGLLLAGMGAEGVMWAFTASEIITWLFLLALFHFRVYPLFGPGSGAAVFDRREFFIYSLPLFLSGTIDLVLNYTDAFMAGYFLDAASVGIYGGALRLASLTALGTELMNPMFLSIITEQHAASRRDRIRDIFNDNNRWILFISMPVAGFLISLSAGSMDLVWGESFRAGAAALALLTLGKLIYYVSITSSFIILMHGASRLILVINVLTAAVNIALNFLLIPRYGISGAAVATGLSLSAQSAVVIIAARRLHRDPGLRAFSLRVAAAAALPALLAWRLVPMLDIGWEMMVGAGIIYTVVYLLLLRAFRAFTDEDRRIWKRIVQRLRGAAPEEGSAG